MNQDKEFLRCGRAAGLAAGPNIKSVLLGKEPRYAPDRTFDTLHVYLELEIDFKKQTVDSLCRTTIKPFQSPLKTLEFDAEGLKVSTVTVGGKPAKFKAKGGKLTITATVAEETEVEVRYLVSRPEAGLHFVYPGKHNPKNPLQLWSQSQPEDAKRWYPCHDSPHQKCTSEVRATVPAGFRLVSNGTLIESGEKNGKALWHWRMDRPHSIYLISIAAGRFSEISESWDDIPVTYYCEKGREADARRGFGKTVRALEFFSKVTGVPYPYDKYAQVAVAEYPGGMEHTTCTTQTDACLLDARAFLDNDLDTLVAHELAHQWFGDLVTCRDWSHAWLNEGFATYMEVAFQEHDKGRDEADYELYQNAVAYFDEDGRRYRRPIVSPAYKNPWTLFDRHTYEKGSWVVHMLRRELGDEVFWNCVKHYLEKHRDGAVETSDLILAIAEVTGRNLKPFFDQWVFRGGYPVLRVHYGWDEKAKKAELWVAQTQEVSEDNPAFKLSFPVRFEGKDWSREHTILLTGREHRFSWKLPGKPLDCQVDPDYTTLKKLSLKKPQSMWLHQLKNAKTAYGRQYAARNACGWTDAATTAALEAAARREPHWGAACEIVRALGGMGTEAAFQALKRLLKDKRPKVRRVAVEALSGYRRPETAALIAPLARKDASILVEAAALRALGRQQMGESVIRAALVKQSYRDVVGAAAVAGLASTRDPRHLELLLKSSRAPHSFARRAQALRALQDYAAFSDRCVPAICDAAGDQDERVILVAVESLGALEDERALPSLEKAAKHANARVRAYAEEALARVRAGFEPKPKK